jgi:predicted transglutaminase-like cysteine proteinase
MKIRITACLFSFLLLGSIFVSAATPIEKTQAPSEVGWWRKTFGHLTWDEVVQTANTPEDIVKAVTRHIQYKADIGDQLTGGKETWKNGYGDCEDMAACIAELCREKGWDAEIEIFSSSESAVGHAVAMGRWKNKIWLASNGCRWVESTQEAKRYIARQMKWNPDKTTTHTWAEFMPAHQTTATASR